MDTVCMIWQVTLRNGVRIIMVETKAVFRGAVLGSTLQSACVMLTVAPAAVSANASVFVVQRTSNNYHFPCYARSLPLYHLLV